MRRIRLKLPPMPVQVAGDHHVVGQFGREDDDVALPGRAYCRLASVAWSKTAIVRSM